MAEETVRPLGQQALHDGTVVGSTRLTPVDDKLRGSMVIPPTTVVPVVFVPGIMGSNLKAKRDILLKRQILFKAGANIWDVSTLTSPMSWWGKDPAFRQAVLNKDAVTVDNRGKIGQGSTSFYADGGVLPRFTDVPTSATPLSELSIETAHKRGWGSVSWQYYGEFLDWLQYQLSDGRLVDGKPNNVFEAVEKLVGTSPHGERKPVPPLMDTQIKKLLDIDFPVYAAGYNWLQSNLDSGRDLVHGVGERGGRVMGIDEIIKHHAGMPGKTCKQVIIVTHSMGGLVARAAALAYGGEGKILGIVHGVQPIDGAAAFYKRLAVGFEGEGWGIPWATSQVLGPTSRETIPEIACNPGPLELAPNQRYNGRKPWLSIKDRQGNVLKVLPEHGDPYTEIYLDTQHVWRAVNPAWLDPAQLYSSGSAQFEFEKTVKKARNYHAKLGGKLHPKTYAHWGADPAHKSWGSITWSAALGKTWPPSPRELAASEGVGHRQWMLHSQYTPTNPDQWSFQTPVAGAGTERDLLSAQNKEIEMAVDNPTDAGDGTVPAAASGAQIANYPGCLIGCALRGFDHQGDYNDHEVRNVLLDALVRLVEPVRVTE